MEKINILETKRVSLKPSISQDIVTNSLRHAFQRKNILICDILRNITPCSNEIQITIFVKTNMLIRYKKLSSNHIKEISNWSKNIKLRQLKMLMGQQDKNFHIINTKIKIIPINYNIDAGITKIILSKMSPFKKSLFSRRYTMFIDFVKILSLICLKRIKIKTLSLLLAQVFKNLQKKNHNKFLSFIKKMFIFLINQNFSEIAGIKLILKGKISGKPRASTRKILVGSVKSKSINSEIYNDYIHVYTIYGTFGLKIWLCFK